MKTYSNFDEMIAALTNPNQSSQSVNLTMKNTLRQRKMMLMRIAAIQGGESSRIITTLSNGVSLNYKTTGSFTHGQALQELISLGYDPDLVRALLDMFPPQTKILPGLDKLIELFEKNLSQLRLASLGLTVHTLSPEILAKIDPKYPKDHKNGFVASPFQEAILNHMASVRELTGHSYGLCILATALGKTILAILDIERQIQIIDPKKTVPEIIKSKKSFQLLFLSHTNEIRFATFSKFKAHFIAKYKISGDLFFEMKTRTDLSKLSKTSQKPKFIFTLFQTLSLDLVSDPFFDNLTHLIIDETHHLLAPSYSTIYSHFIAKAPKYVLGITATLRHATDPSGAKLKQLYRNVVYVSYDWKSAKNTHFPPLNYYEILAPEILKGRRFKEYNLAITDPAPLKQLAKSLEIAEKVPNHRDPSAEFVAKTIRNYIIARIKNNLPPRNKILVFVRTVSLADKVADSLNRDKLKARSAHYRLSESEQNFQLFQNGKINILVTVMKAVEGYDLPGIDCVVLARPTSSETVFVQQMGRSLRIDPGKTDVDVLDLCFNLRRRWIKLSEEVSRKELDSQIKDFWHVSSLKFKYD